MKKVFLEKISDKKEIRDIENDLSMDLHFYQEGYEDENFNLEVNDEIGKIKLSHTLKASFNFKNNLNQDDFQKKKVQKKITLEVNDINKTFIKKYKTLNAKNAKNKEILTNNAFNNNLIDSPGFNEISPISDLREDPIFSNGSELNYTFTLRNKKKNKKIFEEFLVIGIESQNLEYLTDYDDLFMTPKILFNYPNKLDENEMGFNVKFLKNICFNDGVPVHRYDIEKEEDWMNKILEKNFFSKSKLSFCLLQQVTPEDIEKYFIFGIKFDDLYIKTSKLKNKSGLSVFIYEKTYLFIANEALCKLFEEIFQYILNIKKLNFLRQLEDYEYLLEENSLNIFQKENDEKTGEQILEILYFFHYRNFPNHDEYISFESKINFISVQYYYPNKYNEEFMAVDWLSKIFFKIIDSDALCKIIIRILLEESFIFISENIENLTNIVLGVSYLIKPFKWPFIIIPNLPLDLINVLESPVPYLLGVLGDENSKNNLMNNANIFSHIAMIKNNKVELILRGPMTCQTPKLNNLVSLIDTSLSNIHYYWDVKKFEDFEKNCEILYKNIYESIKYELIEPLQKAVAKNINNCNENFTSHNTLELSNFNQSIDDNLKNENDLSFNLKSLFYDKVRQTFISLLKQEDKGFGEQFSETQVFQIYLEQTKQEELSRIDTEYE